MTILWFVLGVCFLVLGIVGAFLPVIPGPICSWMGILFAYFISNSPINTKELALTGGIAIILVVLDYIVPAYATKKYGGTKYGVWGSMVGLLLGMFFAPFGIILGPLLGAYLGEYIKDSQDKERARKAAIGSFVGFLFSTSLKFVLAVVYAVFFFRELWAVKEAYF